MHSLEYVGRLESELAKTARGRRRLAEAKERTDRRTYEERARLADTEKQPSREKIGEVPSTFLPFPPREERARCIGTRNSLHCMIKRSRGRSCRRRLGSGLGDGSVRRRLLQSDCMHDGVGIDAKARAEDGRLLVVVGLDPGTPWMPAILAQGKVRSRDSGRHFGPHSNLEIFGTARPHQRVEQLCRLCTYMRLLAEHSMSHDCEILNTAKKARRLSLLEVACATELLR